MKSLSTPISEKEISDLNVGDIVTLSGYIYCGRDAVLPLIVDEIISGNSEDYNCLKGNVIFHTAVSCAGIGPTSSNKLEIESSMIPLSKYAGVKIHLGKGRISDKTIQSLCELNAVYAVIPPVSALLSYKTTEITCFAHPELAMEAFYKVKIKDYPVIIAAARGKSVYK